MLERIKHFFGIGGPFERGFAPPVPQKDPMAGVRWMNADDPGNPFHIRILNCLTSAMGLLSTTKDPKVAKSYADRRAIDGRDYIGKLPGDPVELPCDLRYPVEGRAVDGAVHRSREMEDKWDIFLHQGRLYFTRSWLGELVACAAIQFAASEARVTSVIINKDQGADSAFAIRTIDYLIKSHIYGWRVPHPLPPDCPTDPNQIAILSFSMYGRHGFAGTFEDTLPFRGPPPSKAIVS